MPAGTREAQILACLIAMLPWVLFALRYRHYWGYSIAPILFLLHIVLFNIARMNGIPADDAFATIWSVGIRIQGIASAGILGFGLYFDLKNNGFNGYVEK